jgi:hypothetical protein
MPGIESRTLVVPRHRERGARLHRIGCDDDDAGAVSIDRPEPEDLTPDDLVDSLSGVGWNR